MERHSHRILSKHFALVKQKLISFANHFDIANHGDLKGYGREALTEEFLKTHLQEQVVYLTGEIIDIDDNRSGQIDIIVQSNNSPKIPLWGNIHLSYADSVIAAIEVKSNLTTEHLKSCFRASKKVKALKRSVSLKLNTVQKVQEKIPYIIFAFTGLSRETVEKHMIDFSKENNIHYDDFCPDLIVVLDKDYYSCKNDGWFFPYAAGGYLQYWNGVPDENLVGMYNYLINLIRSYNSLERIINIKRYFDKPVGN